MKEFNMYQVYILEDNKEYRQQISKSLGKFSKHIKIHMIESNFDKFAMTHIGVPTFKNIYIIDINLGHNISGMQIAKEIRELDYLGTIIFLTSHVDMAPLNYSYHLRASDFIDKSRADCFDALNACICHTIKANDKITERSLSFKSKKSLVNINMDHILFIETSHKKRQLFIHTIDDVLEYPGSIKSILEELDYHFKQVHKSYIVNTKNMKEIDITSKPYKIIFNDKKHCYLSSKFVSDPVKLLKERTHYETSY